MDLYLNRISQIGAIRKLNLIIDYVYLCKKGKVSYEKYVPGMKIDFLVVVMPEYFAEHISLEDIELYALIKGIEPCPSEECERYLGEHITDLREKSKLLFFKPIEP